MVAVGIAALTILVLFLGWIFYLALTSPPPPSRVTTTDVTVAGGTVADGRVFLPCAPGQCALNFFNGIKRCPQEYGSIMADASFEVCSGEFVCDSPVAPYAVQADGSSTYAGVCPSGVPCPCSRNIRCPEYVVSGFRLQQGQPESGQNQRMYFTQFTQILGPVPTIVLSNPTREYCAVPLSWLPLSTPGCPGVKYGDAPSIVECMGLASACSGVRSNPCAQGTLAMLPNKPLYQLREADLFTSQYGCVRGEACPCGQLAVWNDQSGSVSCVSIPGVS